MKRNTLSISLIAMFAVGAGLTAKPALAGDEAKYGADDKPAVLPKCPVMDEAIDFTASTKTDDGPVFFCCTDCIEKYNKTPEKFAEKVAEQRKALKDRAKVQVLCPISGDAVSLKSSIEHDGQKIFFCCNDCIPKYQADPSKYKSAMANSYTYQTKCPVMGEGIDPKSSTVLATGQKIYYCCDGCDKKLKKTPAKYVAALATQGINIDPAKILAGAGKKLGEHAGHGHEGHDHGDGG